MLKDGSSEVWPEDAENIFLEGLREYWKSPCANWNKGRSRWRNSFLVEYLHNNGIERSKKQVASHIQVLRNMWKGHKQYALVAGPEELGELEGTAQDGYDAMRRVDIRGTSHSPTRSRRRHSMSSTTARLSPPSTPSSYDSEFSESALNSAGAHGMNLSPLFSNHTSTSIKSEYLQSPRALLCEPSSLPVVPELAYSQGTASQNINQVVGFRLWPSGLDANYYFVDVDGLPYPNSPTSPNMQSQFSVSPSGFTRVSLQFRLYVPEDTITRKATGFLGTVIFANPVISQTEVTTRVFAGKTSIHEETKPLIFTDLVPGSQAGFGSEDHKGFSAHLPESALSRCGWIELETATKTLITQTVRVDGEDILVVMYEIVYTPNPAPCSQLLRWKKHVDSALYGQANGYKQYATVSQQQQLTPPPSASSQMSHHVLPMHFMPYQHQQPSTTYSQSTPGLSPSNSYSTGMSSSYSPPLLTRSLSCATSSSFAQGTQAPAQPPHYPPIASSYQLYGQPTGLLLDM